MGFEAVANTPLTIVWSALNLFPIRYFFYGFHYLYVSRSICQISSDLHYKLLSLKHHKIFYSPKKNTVAFHSRSVPKTQKSQFSGHFSCEKPSKVSQKPENLSFRDTFHAKSRLKCPKNPKISAFGTLFMRKAV